MQATEFSKHYTPEEYLTLEEQAEFKSEYHDGEIIPMTGGSLNHNEIITNFWALKTQLRRQGFRFFSSDVRLWLPQYRRFVYPDVMVIEGEPVLYQNRVDTVLNPKLIVEVLSKSTQDYDMTDKFRYYRSIPGLQEYILVNQYLVEVQQYTKTDQGFWIYRSYESIDELLKFGTIEAELKLTEIYAGISLDPEPNME
ncbi:Uma2 family endonuclease [Leptolyngbya sp. AN03gr2]|uniref:Uma2 family endonuclease n=1 Tax=unclassified Leptolyngbya TaxID=2650499 RepID=UPI003D3105F3